MARNSTQLVRRRWVAGAGMYPAHAWFLRGRLIKVELTERGQDILAHDNMMRIRSTRK